MSLDTTRRRELVGVEESLVTVYKMIRERAKQLGIKVDLRGLFVGARKTLRRITQYTELPNGARAVYLGSSVRSTPRMVKIRTLDGETRREWTVDLAEDLHTATVTDTSMKCTCKFAELEAIRADKILASKAKEKKIQVDEYLFTRYNLCKHTLATLATALVRGDVELNDSLMRTLERALIAYGLAKEAPGAIEALERRILTPKRK